MNALLSVASWGVGELVATCRALNANTSPERLATSSADLFESAGLSQRAKDSALIQ
jgi:hypothetical protein